MFLGGLSDSTGPCGSNSGVGGLRDEDSFLKGDKLEATFLVSFRNASALDIRMRIL